MRAALASLLRVKGNATGFDHDVLLYCCTAAAGLMGAGSTGTCHASVASTAVRLVSTLTKTVRVVAAQW